MPTHTTNNLLLIVSLYRRFSWDKCTLVCHYDDDLAFSKRRRLPVVTFVHSDICVDDIVRRCREEGIVVRGGFFLSEVCIQRWGENWIRAGGDEKRVKGVGREGAVRVSMAHYNTEEEVRKLIRVLEGMDGW